MHKPRFTFSWFAPRSVIMAPLGWLLILLSLSPSPALAQPTPAHVPGFERLRRSGSDHWQREAGDVLFSELSCAACHHPADINPSSLDWKFGPDLSTAGDRLQADFIRAFLTDPASIDPGTTMPDVISHHAPAEKALLIEDLTHHLMSQRAAKKGNSTPLVGSAKNGKPLFHELGCVACHDDSSLSAVAHKYAPGELARFLMAPLKVRPAGRMPDQRLGKKDAAHLAAYLSSDSPPPNTEWKLDPERAQRGKAAFQSLGCVSCHEPHSKSPSVPMANLHAGCLADDHSATRTPSAKYTLDEIQLTTLRLLLRDRAAASKAAPSPSSAATIHTLLLQRDCFACHSRGGFGGPSPDIAPHFTSTKDDLGDLGRLPPLLDGVGRKFQPNALSQLLRGRGTVRRYMRVKMPGFDDELIRELTHHFESADLPKKSPSSPIAVKPPKSEDKGTTEGGRQLVGVTGYACITCHDINGQPSLGIGAYDLAEMPKRLRREWLQDFLINPAAFPTGTRMPFFWPAGQPINPHLAGGTAQTQIDSLWRYLTEVDESLPPPGMAERATALLQPMDRPVIFRTFLQGTGTHAIAVGFPSGINLAFDAQSSRWSLAWTGKYLDADSTWNQRYVKMDQPLGDHLVKLESLGDLVQDDQPPLPKKYTGYRIDKQGIPIFQYQAGNLQVEDKIEPSGKERTVRRTIRIITSGHHNEAIHFRATPSPTLKVQLQQGASANTPLPLNDTPVEIIEEVSW